MLSLILIILPLISSLLVLPFKGKTATSVAFFFSILQLVFTLIIWNTFRLTPVAEVEKSFGMSLNWISHPNISFTIGMDGISFLMVLLTNILIPLIILLGFNKETKNANRFYALILFMQFALIGVFTALDGFLYYVFWELALIPIYFIALGWGNINRVQSTLKFFLFTITGSILMLFALMYLYWSSPMNSLKWSDLTHFPVCSCKQTWLFWMFFVAYAIKIPIVPFHTWQADTYHDAPAQGTMLLSGIMLKMGTYSLLRWLIPILPSGVMEWSTTAIWLSVAGVVFASVIAIMQPDIKRLLAYSSLAHVGLISAGIFTFTLQGYQGALFQMFSHGLYVIGLFACAEIILRRTGTGHIYSLGSIRLHNPLFALLFLMILLASIALPLSNGFIGEFFILFSLFSIHPWISAFAGLSVILGAVYMLRMYQFTMLGDKNEKVTSFESLAWNEKLLLGIIAFLVFFFGIFPQSLLSITEPFVQSLIK